MNSDEALPDVVVVVAGIVAVIISCTISLSRCARSIRFRASKSTNNNDVAPRAQPMMTPTIAPNMETLRHIGKCRCSCVIFGVRSQDVLVVKNRSKAPPNTTPETSDTTCPAAAADKVAKPKLIPNVASMYPPAWINTN